MTPYSTFFALLAISIIGTALIFAGLTTSTVPVVVAGGLLVFICAAMFEARRDE